ncbi:unnamed protein product [Zymoseptoria tritici ST99CH_3D1]|uniref:RING-type domain-containing protein n=2 Tax=Zymoseptoria tritici TaxID=1047171 RepID=F9XGP7_ZYMTI|nr:uncharacterized protein MYCGRDRAFT_94669 [Zymoseptoria tritici IPO323]EGP85998.1 hypothetical protein MYCGRDRAFT_94669 [Zymoseptoria tritici IPO323]SMQ52746.1 unnamed protein product [Zymoseptoria tritici ST99CH_3D7]SMR57933.1 unnamed protein product [Zymoseptoria tritici ST99CH_3D1]
MGSQQSHPDESAPQDTGNANTEVAGDVVADDAPIESPPPTTEDQGHGDDQTQEEAPVSPSTSNPHRPSDLEILRRATYDLVLSSSRLLAAAINAVNATDTTPLPFRAREAFAVESQPDTARDVPRYAENPRLALLIASPRSRRLAGSLEDDPNVAIALLEHRSIWPPAADNEDDDDDQDMPLLIDPQNGAHFEDSTRFYAPPRTIYTSTQLNEDISASMRLVTLRPSTTSGGNSSTHNDVDSAEVTNLKHVVARMEALCALCLDDLANRVYITSCGHGGCVRCVIEWLKCSDTCPSCRRVVSHEGSTLVEVDDEEDGGGLDGNDGGETEHDGQDGGSDEDGAGGAEDAANDCGEPGEAASESGE